MTMEDESRLTAGDEGRCDLDHGPKSSTRRARGKQGKATACKIGDGRATSLIMQIRLRGGVALVSLLTFLIFVTTRSLGTRCRFGPAVDTRFRAGLRTPGFLIWDCAMDG